MNDYLLEETEIELTPLFLSAMAGTPTGYEAILAALIGNNTSRLKDMLSGYYYDNKGSVEQVELKKGSLVPVSEFSGMFGVAYVVHYHLGCSDVSYDDNQKMKIAYEIDPQRKVIKLAGERIPLRGPDEL